MMKYALVLWGSVWGGILFAQQQPLYKNAGLPVETRVADLLKRMTPEEKFRQLFMVAGDLGQDSLRFREGLFGFQINTVVQQHGAANQMMTYNAGQDALNTVRKVNAMQRFFMEDTRLGIPMIAFDEALHGLVRQGSTAFPQSIALAATFDTTLMNQVSEAIALECRARGLRMILSPVINLATDVRWGRVEETYGEDPFLTSLMGVSYVRALESSGIITTPKHFAVNHGEGGRDSYPIHYNERLLNELYFVPFKAVIEKAGARSIMTAYNSIDGRPCTSSNWLLNETLKKQWGFRGFVISDAAATGGANVLHFTARDYEDAGKQSIESGLDVIFQTDFSSYPLFSKPFLDGTANQASVDSAVARVLRMKFELGLFDHPYTDEKLIAQIDLAKHRKLAFEAAVKSAVLLKNEQLLPLSGSIEKIVVIGTDAVEARLGGYSGPGNQPVNMVDGLKNVLGERTRVEYAPGCGRAVTEWTVVDGAYLTHDQNGQHNPGLQAAYFNNVTLEGTSALQRIDGQIRFQWTLFSPAPEVINYDFFSARWNGFITAPESGTFRIGIDGNDGYRLFINDQLLIDNWNGQGYHTTLESFRFTKGQSYPIRIEYKESAGNSWFKLIWTAGVKDESETQIRQAVKLADKSDVAIVVCGIEEGEFRDRSSLKLPGRQEELIRRVAATGTPVVVVLVGGSAITMDNWLNEAGAVLDVWYPGEEGGHAVAELLTGKANPSGKLPVTFPRSEGQLPLVYNHKPTGRGDDYNDASGQPLFPFGFGLSYTTFEYTNLRAEKTVMGTSDTATFTCTIRNTGTQDGEEVMQLYITDELATVARPVKELKAIQRVALKPGESKEVTFRVTPEMLQMLNAQMNWVAEPGSFRVMIGSSSKDIRLRTKLVVE